MCSIEEVDDATENEDLLELLFSSFEDEELSSKIRSRLCFFAGVSLSCLFLLTWFSGSLDYESCWEEEEGDVFIFGVRLVSEESDLMNAGEC